MYGKGTSQICDFDDDNPRTAETRFSRARTVITHAPALADQVIAGSLKLDAAYKDACEAKKVAESYETKDCDIQLGQQEWQHGVTCKKIALTPLAHYRVALTLQLTFTSIAHPTLRLLAERLHDEIAARIVCPDLLEAAA